MSATNSKTLSGDNSENKFTKEYKSPQQSRFKMASFTEMVKNKSKGKNSPTQKASTATKESNTKLRPRLTYLSSTIRKPATKAVKHHEIDLQLKEKSASK